MRSSVRSRIRSLESFDALPQPSIKQTGRKVRNSSGTFAPRKAGVGCQCNDRGPAGCLWR